MEDTQLTQLLEAINEPKVTISLEKYTNLIDEIDRLKKKYETGEKELLELIAGYHITSCLNDSTIKFNNIKEAIEAKGFELRLDDKGLHLIKKK